MLHAYHRYGERVNSYDALKFLAIVLMTLDHVGAYFYPDEMLWRVAGRICVPLWFFFIGYSSHRQLRADIWIIGLLMVPLDPLTGGGWFSLPILLTMCLTRWLLTLAEDRELLTKEPLAIWVASLVFAAPTYFLFEYGTFGVMLAALGVIKRKGLDEPAHQAFWWLSIISFTAAQCVAFPFGYAEQGLVVLGILGVSLTLKRFTITPLKTQPTTLIAAPIKLTARYSLYYYAIHKTALQIVGKLL